MYAVTLMTDNTVSTEKLRNRRRRLTNMVLTHIETVHNQQPDWMFRTSLDIEH